MTLPRAGMTLPRPPPLATAAAARGGASSGARRAAASVACRAEHRARRGANAAGPWFVDEACIDCAACRWIDPDTFVEAGGGSAVVRQPETPAQRETYLI